MNHKEKQELVDLVNNLSSQSKDTIVWKIEDRDFHITDEEYDYDAWFYADEEGEGHWFGDDLVDIAKQVTVTKLDEYDDIGGVTDLNYVLESIESRAKPVKYYYKVEHFFLTKTGAQDHLRVNSHHYSEHVKITPCQTFRNYELRLLHHFLKSLNVSKNKLACPITGEAITIHNIKQRS